MHYLCQSSCCLHCTTNTKRVEFPITKELRGCTSINITEGNAT